MEIWHTFVFLTKQVGQLQPKQHVSTTPNWELFNSQLGNLNRFKVEPPKPIVINGETGETNPLTSWWLNVSTNLKNMQPSNWESFPQVIRDEN